MGNIESSEIGNIGSIWDQQDVVGSYYRDDDLYRDSYYRSQDDDTDRSPSRTPARSTPARTAPPSPTPNTKEKDDNPPPEEAKVAEPAAPSVPAAEIVNEAADVPQEQQQAQAEDAGANVANELNISKSQKSYQVAPEATATESADAGTTVVVKKSHVRSSLTDVPWALLFILHLLLVAAGIVYLNIEFIRNMTQRKLHNLQRWFPQLGAAVLTGGAFALLCQALFRRYTFVMVRSILWASTILTFGAALMLVSTSMPANLGVGILCLIFSICQSLYACWVSNRIRYAADLLHHSLNAARSVRGTYLISMWVLLVASVWVVFWSFGVVSALSFRLAPLIVLGLLVSLAWTLETLRNMVCTITAGGVAAHYLSNASHPHWNRSLHSAFTSCFGSICIGSFIVPILHILRVMVALHRKAFFQASKDTFNLFSTKRFDIVIEKDLTSSFCVLSGISGGMLCVLVSGGWTFGTHKALTSSVSIVAFFIGYFLVRITMAVPQGAVCAHYYSAATQELQSSPVPDRLKELSADIDTEIPNHT